MLSPGLSRRPPLTWALFLSFALSPLALARSLDPRDGMHMHHHGQPLTEINETEILMWHLPTPPSYWSIDIENPDPTAPRYPGLVAVHVTFMILAFFVALPAGNALRQSSFPTISTNSTGLLNRHRSPFSQTPLACICSGHVLRPMCPWLCCQCSLQKINP